MNELNDFVTNFRDLYFLDKNGNIVPRDELDNYILNSNKVSYSERLQVGDTVKIKNMDDLVMVKYIDYEISGVGSVDYAGSIKEKDTELILFNQKDVEGKVLSGKHL